MIDLVTERGDVVYSYCHEPLSGDADKGLACCTLLEHNGRVYLLTMSKNVLYVYRLLMGRVPYGHALVWATFLHGAAIDWEDDIIDIPLYQAFAGVKNTRGDLFMFASGRPQDSGGRVGGAKRDLDTWHVVIDDFDRVSTLRRISGMQVFSTLGDGIFQEGMCSRRVGPTHLRFYMAPWDYRQVHCANNRVGKKCTKIWAFARKW